MGLRYDSGLLEWSADAQFDALALTGYCYSMFGCSKFFVLRPVPVVGLRTVQYDTVRIRYGSSSTLLVLATHH